MDIKKVLTWTGITIGIFVLLKVFTLIFKVFINNIFQDNYYFYVTFAIITVIIIPFIIGYFSRLNITEYIVSSVSLHLFYYILIRYLRYPIIKISDFTETIYLTLTGINPATMSYLTLCPPNQMITLNTNSTVANQIRESARTCLFEGINANLTAVIVYISCAALIFGCYYLGSIIGKLKVK